MRGKENNMIKPQKPKFWLGLSTIGVALTGLMFVATGLVNSYEGLIYQALNMNTTKVSSIDSDEVTGSDYAKNGQLTDEGFEEMIADSYKFCERLVEQGSVLLKNNVKDGVPTLPLAKTERNISLLGQGSKNLFMRSGAGGAEPNTGLVVTLDKAFEKAGFDINRTVFDKYSSLSQSQMTSPGTNVEHSFSGFYTDSMRASFAEHNDAAVITFVRIGTENTDPSDGQLDLKNDEKQLLKMVKDSGVFKKIIVLINSPMPMSVDWVDNEEYGIDACVFIGSPGYYGAAGAVHVLTGEDADGNPVNPSGHCPDTFAASASSSPAYVNFGQSSIAVYCENVYVGYKYYETRYFDSIMEQGNANGNAGIKISSGANWDYADEMGYPFGYGMSYTTFEQKIKDVKYNASTDTYDVKVEVKNTGNVDGKSSIQVYVNAPFTDFDQSNGLEKSAIALMAYDKVDVPAGKTVERTLNVERYFLCTYDYKVNRSYVLEGGDYYFAIGNGAHEAVNNVLGAMGKENLVDHNGEAFTPNANGVKKVTIEEDFDTYKKSHYNDTVVENQFDDADYNEMVRRNGGTPITYLTRTDWQGTWPKKITNNPAKSNDSNMSQYYKKTADTPSYKAGDGVEYNVPYIDADGNESTISFSEMHNVPLEGTVEKGRFAGMEGADVWDAFIKQMNLDDLAISVSDNRGILAVGKVGKAGNYVAEGPEGLLAKFKYGKDKSRAATGFPTGPVYTGTWDHVMQQKYGGFFGEEALYCGVACVNAPGANINRTPYGSRASEYMSEDGVLNYYTASNVVGEARKKGLVMNIKHCFLNNQETGRQRIHTYCNEQAIREIYLRPFEGALTRGHGLGIMTSYNRIGARYAACHEPLMKNVMRGEWGYKGLIIDDALTGSNTDQYSNGPAMLACGTDMFCLDGNRGGQLKDWVKTNDDGTILAHMQRANKYIMYAMSRSFLGGIDQGNLAATTWLKPTVNGITIGFGVITVCLLGVYAFAEVTTKFLSKKKEEQAE